MERRTDAPAQHQLVLVTFIAPDVASAQAEDVFVIEEGAELLDVHRAGRDTGGIDDVTPVAAEGLVELTCPGECRWISAITRSRSSLANGSFAAHEKPAPRKEARTDARGVLVW